MLGIIRPSGIKGTGRRKEWNIPRAPANPGWSVARRRVTQSLEGKAEVRAQVKH